MSTRYLVAAAVFLGSACAAQADVLPSTSTTPVSTYLTSWTSNGTDIASSGVLGSGTSLVGGSTYGSGNLTQSLMEQASAGTSSKLSYEKGVSGTYVVATANFKMAAMMGEGVSVISGNNGKLTVVANQTTATAPATAAGDNASGGGSVSAPAAGGTPTGGSAPAAGGNNAGSANDTAGTGGTTGGSGDVNVSLPADVGGGGAIGAGLPVTAALDANAVPEPSSIALLFAGMMGALALNRRSKR